MGPAAGAEEHLEIRVGRVNVNVLARTSQHDNVVMIQCLWPLLVLSIYSKGIKMLAHNNYRSDIIDISILLRPIVTSAKEFLVRFWFVLIVFLFFPLRSLQQ